MPVYVRFLHAAHLYQNAILWTHAEYDPWILGPRPKEEADVSKVAIQLAVALSEIRLVGSSPVVRAAELARYTLWDYRNTLEEDPTAFGQGPTTDAINSFLREAQATLGVEEAVPRVPTFREWSSARESG